LTKFTVNTEERNENAAYPVQNVRPRIAPCLFRCRDQIIIEFAVKKTQRAENVRVGNFITDVSVRNAHNMKA